VGTGWLFALHARSSLAGGRVWQADFLLSGLCDQVLALACVRHGLPVPQRHGADDLPPEVIGPLRAALPRDLDPEEPRRAFTAATEALVREAIAADLVLTGHITSVVRQLARNVPYASGAPADAG
jgi:hypothetical protein